MSAEPNGSLTPVDGRFATPANEYRNAAGLTADQCVGAVLDAHGFSGGEIAKYLGTTKQNVSLWRHKFEYQEEIERAREGMLERMGGQLGNLRVDVMDAAQEAVAVLREGLSATDSQGAPRWTVRLKAAESLVGNAVRLVQAEARVKAAGAQGRDTGVVEGSETSSVIMVSDEVVRRALGMLDSGDALPDVTVVEPAGEMQSIAREAAEAARQRFIAEDEANGNGA